MKVRKFSRLDVQLACAVRPFKTFILHFFDSHRRIVTAPLLIQALIGIRQKYKMKKLWDWPMNGLHRFLFSAHKLLSIVSYNFMCLFNFFFPFFIMILSVSIRGITFIIHYIQLFCCCCSYYRYCK